MPVLLQKKSMAETIRNKRFESNGKLEGKNISNTCRQVERMVDLTLGRVGAVYSGLNQLSEHDQPFRPGLRELAMVAHFNQLQEKKIFDMGEAVSKAIDAIEAMQKNAKLMNALSAIREGKGDKTAIEILCTEFDDLEKKFLAG